MENDIVKCEICGLEMKTRINGSHLLRIHNITLTEYKNKYPNTIIGKRHPKLLKYECKICNKLVKGSNSLSRHLKISHNIKLNDYYIKYYLNEIHPKCKCGCKENTKFNNMKNGFDDYIIHHNPIWNKGLSINIDDRLKKMYLNPRWNKNLTKETDERVNKNSISIKKSWNKDNLNKRSESYKKTMMKKYGVINGFQLDYIKKKSKKTMILKYGGENPQFCNDIKFKWKSYTFPSGKQVKYQGYENFGINLLLKEHNENDIIVDRKLIPKIKYEDFDGKIRKYCSDMWIPKENLLVEIKSNYTYNLHKQNVHHKQKGVISCGYNFKLLVFNDDGTLNNIIND